MTTEQGAVTLMCDVCSVVLLKIYGCLDLAYIVSLKVVGVIGIHQNYASFIAVICSLMYIASFKVLGFSEDIYCLLGLLRNSL